MAEKCGLEAFPRELLLRILVLTDIYTVLTISQVNSFFHTLASTKQLWLFLTKDLFLRGLIDIHSDEANLSLSSHELIAQVKRAVRGPRTWAPDSTTAPSLIQRFTIPLELEHSTFCCLLGGQYIVFRAQQSVECYHVSTGRCVWSWGRPDFKVLEVVFSVCRGSKTTAFVTVFNEQVSMHMRLMLLDVDLESGQSREMFQVPSMGIEDMSLKEPQSAEGYLGCVLVAPGDDPSNPVPVWRALLVNLRTEQYIVLDCGLGPVWISFNWSTRADACITEGQVTYHSWLHSPPEPPIRPAFSPHPSHLFS
ncbi:hypothetical protein C8R45DRAFT_433321 [Mycena sanguinolenta]|nr:hypothetical protein C8R45DRAFT_433321 [Mycena sanguinolenta]